MRALTTIAILSAIVLCTLASPESRAERATPEEMERVCQNWLSYVVHWQGHWAGALEPRITGVQEIVADNTVVGRCFSIAPRGYVVVPVLKELPSVKAYSDKCDLDATLLGGFSQLLREVLKQRIDLFVKTYGSLEASQPATGPAVFGRVHRARWDRFLTDPDRFHVALRGGALAGGIRVGELLTTAWHQGAPYNDLCPMGDGGRCVVGCVATATAQIMKYHDWPPSCDQHQITWDWDGDDSCNGVPVPETRSAIVDDPYDWANMPDDCTTNSPQVEQDAVAELCYEVGVAAHMDWGRCASGAHIHAPTAGGGAQGALSTVFRYDGEMEHLYRSAYSTDQWFDLIQHEIDYERPVLYAFTTNLDPPSAHAIVCDGWEEDGEQRVHINYGWNNGSNTGWYTLDNIPRAVDPDADHMVINIRPLYRVREGGDGDFPTIQAAIDAVDDGDAVGLADGTFTGVGNRGINFRGKAITVRSISGNPLTCIIDCDYAERGFNFFSGEGADSVLQGITITRGDPDYLSGGGVLCNNNSSPTIRSCVFWNNSARYGGGLRCYTGCSPQIINCTFYGNWADYYGGGLYFSGTSNATLTRTLIAFGTYAEAVWCASGAVPTLTCCDIFGNAGGDWTGRIASQLGTNNNVRVDPLFCNAAGGNFNVCMDSACAPSYSPCNARIGASAFDWGCSGCRVPLTITDHPDGAERCAGESVEFSVTADGTPPLSYQWQRWDNVAGWQDIPGARASTYAIASVVTGDAGRYRASVSNFYTTRTSNSATLAVDVVPNVTDDPDDAEVCEDDLVIFSVTADGGSSTAPLSYRWYQDGYRVYNNWRISGATTATLTIDPVIPNDAGNYHVVVDNDCGQDTSAVATLTVKTLPTIQQHPQSQTVSPGDPVSFSVVASGTPAPTYQWRRNGVDLVDAGRISGATTATLTINPVQPGDDGQYDVVVSNECNQLGVTSTAATLTVGPAITGHPVDQTACDQDTGQFAVVFTVTAVGTPPLSYQWRKDGVNLVNDPHITGATTPTLTIDPVSLDDAGEYDVRVGNSQQQEYVTSNPATLTVLPIALTVPDDYPTIQAAIDAICDRWGTVTVRNGIYSGPGNTNVDFRGKSITVRSESGDPQACIIDCRGQGRGFIFQSGETGCALEGFTITNGNVLTNGGGILCLGSSPMIINCILSHNSAGQKGGGFAGFGFTGTLDMCTIFGNSAGQKGGATYFGDVSEGWPSIGQCTLYGNSAPIGGGVCAEDWSQIPVEHTIIASSTQGEAVYCDAYSWVGVTCCDVWGNAGGDYLVPFGCIASQAPPTNNNISADPLFCDPPGEDFTLNSGSPCANAPNCGVIGAWNVGCSGACCLPDGSCMDDLAPSACTAAGGTYAGSFTVCSGLDCNGNGVDDLCDIASGTSADCNRNGVPDECDIANCPPGDPSCDDCDGNGIPDECDLATCAGEIWCGDCDGNRVPDGCEHGVSDCNGNGLSDECEVASGLAPDCNNNGVPDECDIAGGGSADCDLNGIPDECESGLEPTIQTPPQDAAVCVGDNAVFTIVATGSVGTLHYQWYQDSSPVGPDSPTLVLTNVDLSDDGTQITCAVSDDCATVTSDPALLTVIAGPSFTTQPESQTACLGDPVTFCVAADGMAPLSYQWRKDGLPIPNATSTCYTIDPVTAADAAVYDVVVTDGCGTATSDPATLTVGSSPAITTQPESQTVCEDDGVTFCVTAEGLEPLSYQWRKDGIAIPNATSACYTIDPATLDDAGVYDVVVTNDCGELTSDPATLTVGSSPAISMQPESQTACQGGAVTFWVSAEGLEPLSYQWRKDGLAIPNATNAWCTIDPVTPDDAGAYDVVLTNDCGELTSDPATLAISPGASITTHPENQTVCQDDPVTFCVTAEGMEPLGYQWRKDGVAIPNARSECHTIDPVTAADAGIYDVVVTDDCSEGLSEVLIDEDFAALPPGWAFVDAAYYDPVNANARLVSSGGLNTAGAAFFNDTGFDTDAFAAEFDFTITNVAGTWPDVSGMVDPDGLCFVVSDAPVTSAGAHGYGIGYRNFPTASFAVEFDAFHNDFDPDSNHVGLDVGGSIESLSTAFVSTDFDETGTWHARVRFEDGQLTVTVTPPGAPPVEVLTATIPPENIPPVKYFGFTSGTGENSADTVVDNLVVTDDRGRAISDPATLQVCPSCLGGDCNGNGIPDDCDIALGFSEDVNGNGIPDECELGDLNCDGGVDAFDIDPFVLALTNPNQYAAQYPDCSATFADMNCDGVVDAFDIDLFVVCLTTGNCRCP